MLTIIRDQDGNIKTYSETALDNYNLAMGETRETVDSTLIEYSRRFMLQAAGVFGQTLTVKAGGDDILVGVSTSLPLDAVDLNINGTTERVPLTAGQGEIILSTAIPGTFIITPADRTMFCAAGNGVLVVEVIP